MLLFILLKAILAYRIIIGGMLILAFIVLLSLLVLILNDQSDFEDFIDKWDEDLKNRKKDQSEFEKYLKK